MVRALPSRRGRASQRGVQKRQASKKDSLRVTDVGHRKSESRVSASRRERYEDDNSSVSSNSLSDRERKPSNRQRRSSQRRRPDRAQEARDDRRPRRQRSYSESSHSSESYSSSDDEGKVNLSHSAFTEDEDSSVSTDASSQYLRSFDTSVNSESRLQEVGTVVRAEDSETDTRSEPSALSSSIFTEDMPIMGLPDDMPADTFSMKSYQQQSGGYGGCFLRTCFCMESESLHGSYGGLRNGDILIASSTMSSHESYGLTPHNESTFDEGHSEVAETRIADGEDTFDDSQIQIVETHIENDDTFGNSYSVASATRNTFEDYRSQASDTTKTDSIAESEVPSLEDLLADDEDQASPDNKPREEEVQTKPSAHEDDKQAKQPSGFSCFNFWRSSPPNEVEDTKEEEANLEDNEVVWERSCDGSTLDTTSASVDEERAHTIANKARSENILTKFKATRPQIENSASSDIQGYNSPYQDTFVLGDNVEISSVSELEAGNGDTAFLIYLRVSKRSLSRNIEISMKRNFGAKIGTCLAPGSSAIAGDLVSIVILDDEQQVVTNPPKLVLEDTAILYLENLGKLSEASYYCLDRKTRRNITKMVRVQQAGKISNLQISPSSELPELDDEEADGLVEGAQYMFCMNLEQLVAKDPARLTNHKSDTLEATFDHDEANMLGSAIEEQLSAQREATIHQSRTAESKQRRSKKDRVKPQVADSEVDSYFDQTDGPALGTSGTKSFVDEAEIDDFLATATEMSTPDISDAKTSTQSATPHGISRTSARVHALRQTRKGRLSSKAKKLSSKSASPATEDKIAIQKNTRQQATDTDSEGSSETDSYLNFLNGDSSRSRFDDGEKAVKEAKAILSNRNNMQETCSTGSDADSNGRHDSRNSGDVDIYLSSPEGSSSIPAHVAQLSEPREKDQTFYLPFPTKHMETQAEELTGAQQSLASYAERTRLAQQILLADRSSRHQRSIFEDKKEESSTEKQKSNGKVQEHPKKAKKSQGRAGSSPGNGGDFSDEFYDAVMSAESRSDLSVD